VGVSLLLVAVPASDALEISDCLLTFIFRAQSSSRCLECAVRFAQYENTALHMAVNKGHHSIVGMLLAADADTNSKNMVSAALPPSFPLPQAPLVLRPTVDKLTQAAAEQQACGARCVEQPGGSSLCRLCTKHDYFMCRVASIL
jgi:hypothetical protein